MQSEIESLEDTDPKLLVKQASSRQRGDAIPPFAVWRSRHLRSRDLLFALIASVVVLNYVRVTVPVLCTYNLEGHVYVNQPQQHEGEFVWDVVCGRLWSPLFQASTSPTSAPLQNSTSWLVDDGPMAPEAMQSLPVSAASSAMWMAHLVGHWLQAVVAYFLVHWISFDPFHMVMPALRFSFLLLLLVPLPYPNLSVIWKAAASSIGAYRTKRLEGAAGRHTKHASSSSCHAARDSCSSSRSSSSNEAKGLIAWYSPNFYWQYPRLRYGVIIIQRILPLLAAARCVGPAYNPYFEFTLGVFCWRMLRKYVYDGWMQYMLVLPLPLHLATCICEFLLVYSTTNRVDAIYYTTAGRLYHLFHLLASVLCMLVLPTLGVMRLERLHKKMYEELQARHAPNSTSSNAHLQQYRQQPHTASSDDGSCVNVHGSRSSSSGGSDSTSSATPGQLSSCTSVSGTDSKPGWVDDSVATWQIGNGTAPVSGTVQPDNNNNSSSSSIIAAAAKAAAPSRDSVAPDDVSGNVEAAADYLHPITDSGTDCSSRAQGDIAKGVLSARSHVGQLSPASAPGTPDQAVRTTSSSILSGLMPQISGLLGDAAAANFVAAVSAAAAPSEPWPATVPTYKSLAEGLPASIKVHTAHSHVSILAPVLTSSLASGLAASLSSTAFPVHFDAACFPGCVQLLATVFVQAKGLAAAAAATTTDWSSSCSSSKASGTAAALLTRVCDGISGFSSAARLQSLTVNVPSRNKASLQALTLSPAAPAESLDAVSVVSDATGPETPRRSVEVGPVFGLMGPDKASLADLDLDSQPAISVAVGASTASRCASASIDSLTEGSSSGWARADQPASVVLEYCEPACLASDKPQEMLLHLQSAALPVAEQRQERRLIVFQNGAVLVDQLVELADVVRAPLPTLITGIVHVALLHAANTPTPPPAASAATALATTPYQPQAPSTTTNRSPTVPSVASGTPLLLVPLLVLPKEAATELQRLWQHAVCVAPTATPRHSLWQSSVAPLVTDIAYLLAHAKAVAVNQSQGVYVASGAAVGDDAKLGLDMLEKQKAGVTADVPVGVRAVLSQVLQHLAAWGLWATMRVVVGSMADAYMIAPSHSAACKAV